MNSYNDDVFDTVTIDDSSEKGVKDPKAIFHYSDGTTEAFDIFALIRENALNVAHPAVLSAIRYWESVVQLQTVLSLTDPLYRSSGIHKVVEQERVTAPVKRAKNNLERVGSDLRRGAYARRVLKPAAIEMLVKRDGLDRQDTYLHKAWQLLGDRALRSIKEKEQRLAELEQRLWASTFVKGHITVDRVIAFFRENSQLLDDGRCVYPEGWEVLLEAYTEWHFGYLDDGSGTAKETLERTSRRDRARGVRPDPHTEPLTAFGPTSARIRLSEITNWLSLLSAVAKK